MNSKKARNRALAAALREEFGTTSTPVMYDGLDIWGPAKGYLEQGLEPEQVARLVRSTLPPHVQDDIKRAKVTQGAKKAMKAAPSVRKSLASHANDAANHGTSQVLNEQAKAVKAGKVLRDAKGRILPREFSELLAEING